MNRKLLSVFFSALVCSTLGHEHLRAHELQRHHARSHPIGFHHARANQQQCSFVCPVPSPSPEANASKALRLVFIKEFNVYALWNINIDVAIVFQIGEPIALLANGKTGVSVVINIDKETVVHYPSGSNDNLWKQSQSLIEYLQKLGHLTNVNNWKNGKSFKLTTVTKDVKNVIISIIETLDVEIGKRAKENPDAVISLISVSIKSLLNSKDVLSLVLLKLNTTLTIIVGGLGKVVNLVAGLKVVGKQLNGGLQTILRNDVNIPLLLGENSGLSDILNLFIQVGVQVDLTKVLGDIIKSPEALLSLAVQLDGGIYYGVSGITAVIYSVQLYAAKKISLEDLIDVLIQVEAVNDHVKITKEVWNNIIEWFFILSRTQSSQFNTSSSWSVLNKFFQDIKNEKLVINGINVSAIINILIATSGNASLSNVVKILVELKPLASLNQLIATLYFRLIYFVISGQGLVFIKALLPDLTISINLSISTSIITQLLKSVNVFAILSKLLRLDIVGVLTELPVLGPILKALDDILKAVGLAAEVTVSSALKAVGSILNDLKNIILFGLGRGGKAPSNGGIAGLSILGGGISVSISGSWKSIASSSSSSSSSSQGTTVSSSSSIVVGGSSSSASTSAPSTSRPTASSSGSPGGSAGGSGSHSGGTSIGGGASSSGGSSSGGSGSHSGGISIGGGGSSAGGSSWGGSGSHSGGISIGGGASSSGGSSGGGSASHSGGTSVGGSASSSGNGGSASGGSASHSGGISIGGSGSSGGGGGWSLGHLLGGGGGGSKGVTSSHHWSLF